MIRLREFSRSDKNRLLELANNSNVARYLHPIFPQPYTPEAAEWWLTEGCREGDKITRVIEYHGEFVGSIGIHPQPDWKSHTGEFGYWLGEDYWGKGIASQAAQLMLDYAFTETPLEKIFATVLHENTASMRILEKLGFELEGVLIRDVYKNNQYYDLHYYSKLKDNIHDDK